MGKLLINVDDYAKDFYKEVMDYNGGEFFVSEKGSIVEIKFAKDEELCIDYIASIIASFFIEKIEPSIIKEEVVVECFNLPDNDILNIYERVQWELLHKDKMMINHYYFDLKNQIFEMLNQNGYFNLKGFLGFRFKIRKIEILNCIDSVIENYYDEYNNEKIIKFVKRFMLLQDDNKRTDKIHVILYGEDKYEMVDDTKGRIDVEELKWIIEEALNEDQFMEVEELHFLLTIIMTLAPKHIVIHTNEKQDPYTSQLLLDIFGENATICKSCGACEDVRVNKEDDEL